QGRARRFASARADPRAGSPPIGWEEGDRVAQEMRPHRGAAGFAIVARSEQLGPSRDRREWTTWRSFKRTALTNAQAHPRRRLVRRSVTIIRNAAAVGSPATFTRGPCSAAGRAGKTLSLGKR